MRKREVGASSQNVVSRTFPHFSQSMLTPMESTLVKLIKNAGVRCEMKTSILIVKLKRMMVMPVFEHRVFL